MENISENYHPLPQPDEVTVRECEDAMGAYFMMFAAIGAGLPLPIINLIASIIYYYINKSNSRFVKFHTLQSLISQIPLTILNAVLVFWAFRIFFYASVSYDQTFQGFMIMVILANLSYFIFSIIAAIRARKGRFYYFIFFGKIAYENTFKISTDANNFHEIVNKPPAI
ncbi:MAG: DUF4870 domain-containing protein [Bacteroidetes bacterium]|nr:DUF4870 domain-containing protein [Bacteroidota bacterium]